MSGFSFDKNQRQMQVGDEDRRYRVTVTLVAEKRPRYWEFHCPACKTKICELSGVLIAVSDVADLDAVPDYQPAPMTLECTGRFCRRWYEFVTLSGRE